MMKHSFSHHTSPFASGRMPLIILSLLLLTDFSCSERPSGTTSTDVDSTPIADKSDNVNGNTSTPKCYLNTLSKDTVFLRLTIENDQVSGNLEYKHYEKDQNKGTINGKMMGDTLLADYSFASEGMQSVREVVFLKKGNLLVEGYGDIEEKEGKTVFKNRAALKFDEKMALREVDCN